MSDNYGRRDPTTQASKMFDNQAKTKFGILLMKQEAF